MKAVLLFFVLLNVLFFGWSQWVALPPGGKLVATVEPAAERLVLFREAYPDIERPAELDVSSLELPEALSTGPDAAQAETSDGTDAAAGNGEDREGRREGESAAQGSEAGAESADGDDARDAGGPAAPVEAGASVEERADAPGAGAGAAAGGDAEDTPDAQGESAAQSVAPATASGTRAAAGAAAAGAAPDAPARSDPASAATSLPTVVRPAPSSAAPVTEAPAVLRSAVAAAAPARCVELGPFALPAEADAAAARLRELSLAPIQRVAETEIWSGHWVHLVPYATRAEAIAVVEMLREGGIEDLYIEPSGEMRNAVSLGLFSDAEGAEIRAGKVRRLGVKPQIRDRRRTGSEYWLDFALPAAVQIEPATFAPASGEPLQLNDRDCGAPSAGG